ncbi:nucleotidyltransferase domain-containing protein [Onishia taeanensis]
MVPDPAALDPVLRLLLRLSRLELSASHRQEALALCQGIDDWSEVTRQAEQQLILPLVYRHLRHLNPPSLSSEEAAHMRCQCLTILQENLLIAAAQQRLVSDFLEPQKIPHLFFKGPSLAARYYAEPAMRCCRDIDLLVPRKHCHKLLEAALQRGYQASDPAHLARDRASLDFALRTQAVITLVDPRGIKVEVHTSLNKTIHLFSNAALLKERELIETEGCPLWVMPTADLFVYICLHHTRHYWSRLHWLVDLDAMQRHPDFSLAAAYACAEQRGLRATMDASLEMYDSFAAPILVHPDEEPGGPLLAACLATLQGGHESELALRRHRPTPEFAFSWQTTAFHLAASRLLRWSNRLRPRYQDYEAWPLPRRWQWLYYFLSPLRALRDRVTSAAAPR